MRRMLSNSNYFAGVSQMRRMLIFQNILGVCVVGEVVLTALHAILNPQDCGEIFCPVQNIHSLEYFVTFNNILLISYKHNLKIYNH